MGGTLIITPHAGPVDTGFGCGGTLLGSRATSRVLSHLLVVGWWPVGCLWCGLLTVCACGVWVVVGSSVA